MDFSIKDKREPIGQQQVQLQQPSIQKQEAVPGVPVKDPVKDQESRLTDTTGVKTVSVPQEVVQEFKEFRSDLLKDESIWEQKTTDCGVEKFEGLCNSIQTYYSELETGKQQLREAAGLPATPVENVTPQPRTPPAETALPSPVIPEANNTLLAQASAAGYTAGLAAEQKPPGTADTQPQAGPVETSASSGLGAVIENVASAITEALLPNSTTADTSASATPVTPEASSATEAAPSSETAAAATQPDPAITPANNAATNPITDPATDPTAPAEPGTDNQLPTDPSFTGPKPDSHGPDSEGPKTTDDIVGKALEDQKKSDTLTDATSSAPTTESSSGGSSAPVTEEKTQQSSQQGGEQAAKDTSIKKEEEKVQVQQKALEIAGKIKNISMRLESLEREVRVMEMQLEQSYVDNEDDPEFDPSPMIIQISAKKTEIESLRMQAESAKRDLEILTKSSVNLGGFSAENIDYAISKTEMHVDDLSENLHKKKLDDKKEDDQRVFTGPEPEKKQESKPRQSAGEHRSDTKRNDTFQGGSSHGDTSRTTSTFSSPTSTTSQFSAPTTVSQPNISTSHRL